MRHKIIALFSILIIFTIFIQITPYFHLLNKLKVFEKVLEHKLSSIKHETSSSTSSDNSYIKKYPFLAKCDVEYKKSDTLENEPLEPINYEKRITRAVIFYYPLKKISHYMKEFRWVYRSWIEMQKYEPAKWRTDLIVFLDDTLAAGNYTKFNELNCLFTNNRKSHTDKPMCTLLPYVSIKDRNYTNVEQLKFKSIREEYSYFYEDIDIFDHKLDKLIPFYKKMQTLNNYGYVDSILMAFDGYNYLKDKYHYLVRSDMDIFLTPLFSKWLPKTCNDFVVGGGGYSNDFNMKKLKRIANYLNLNFADIRNLGSTWYSTPTQFCLVSYLTLISMAYLSNEEFTSVERDGKVGTLNWPEWHYGVLLLYGQNVALNHLVATNQIKVVMYADIIDYSSGNNRDIFKSVHIHVYHGREIFSKFDFYDGVYENVTVAPENLNKTNYYCLHLALESKRLSGNDLVKLANIESAKKS